MPAISAFLWLNRVLQFFIGRSAEPTDLNAETRASNDTTTATAASVNGSRIEGRTGRRGSSFHPQHNVDYRPGDHMLLNVRVHAAAVTDPVDGHLEALDGDQHVVDGSVCVRSDEDSLALENVGCNTRSCCCCRGKGRKRKKGGGSDLRVEQADDMRHSAGLSRARHTLHLQPVVSAHFRLLNKVRVFVSAPSSSPARRDRGRWRRLAQGLCWRQEEGGAMTRRRRTKERVKATARAGGATWKQAHCCTN